MRSHKIFFAILAAGVFVIGLASCASHRAPSGWLSDPRDLAKDPYGGWIELETEGDRQMGELLAVGDDTIYVAGKDGLAAVPVSTVVSGRLVAYDHGSNLGVVMAIGTLSTLSHGALLVVTVPMWLIGGGLAAAARSREPVIDYPADDLGKIAMYARFPQGLPPGLDRSRIGAKHGSNGPHE